MNQARLNYRAQTKENMSKAKTVNPLSVAERIAVAAAMASSTDMANFKKELAPGTVTGDVTLRVKFDLTKGEESDASATSNLLSRAVIGRAAVLMGVQRDFFFNALREAALEAIAKNQTVADGIAAEDARVLEQLDRIDAEVIAKIPKTKKSGTTRVNATVELIAAN